MIAQIQLLIKKQVFCALPVFILLHSLHSSALAWPGVVQNVYDGDTVLIAPSGNKDAQIGLRLYGVDAPESAQKGGKAATKYLRRILPKRANVEVIPMGTDRYGRAVGLVIYNGKCVNRQMLEAGHAWLYEAYCKAKFCRKWAKLQKKAQAGKKGLWSDSGAEPPWQWRKANK